MAFGITGALLWFQVCRCFPVHMHVHTAVCELKYAGTRRCGCSHAYLRFEPLDLRVLVLQLSAKLIGCDLFRLQDLDQVDVLLHEDLTLDDDVGVTDGERTGAQRKARFPLA